MALQLWLIRHGETEHNIKRVFQGQLDTPLTERGIEQAKHTAVALGGVEFDRIYSSDLQRAFNTALPIAEERDVDVEPDVRLRELHYGVLQGVPYTEFREVLRAHGAEEEWGAGVFSEGGSAPPGGESLQDLIDRTGDFIEEATGSLGGSGRLAVVTHGGTIRTIMTQLLGMPPTSRSAFALANCGVTCFTNANGEWQLEFHNRVYWGSDFSPHQSTV